MSSNVKILPSEGRPDITREELEHKLISHKDNCAKYELLVVGIRGFFYSMGKSLKNERGIYDDALILYVPSLNIFEPFNGNTDPSRIHKGYGTSEQTKGMAVLKPGFWPVYRFAKHKNSYEAICQRAGKVTVIRDGIDNKPYEDTGEFGINIHRGGNTTTSSLGCQTIPPQQWDEFYKKAQDAALKLWGNNWRKETVAYVLLDQ